MTLNTLKISLIALAASTLWGTTTLAQAMSSADYQTGRATIKAEYSVDKKACASLAGNAKDICVAKAKGKEDVAKAELDHRFEPTPKTQYNLQVAQAEATYDVAKQQCDDLAGNPKSVCIKEAKAAKVAAKADASAKMKSSAVSAKADEKSAKAQNAASSEQAEIRSDAADEKRTARYKVAVEKCAAFAATAKSDCLTEAKVRFDKL